MTSDPIKWLLQSDEPWTRYRTMVDLLHRPEDDIEVQAARAQMVAHPQVQDLIAQAGTWPGHALKRHNDASHPIYALSTLADFGLRVDDPGMGASIQAVIDHQAPEGAFQTRVNVAKSFGGTGEDTWSWMVCDAPTLLYSVQAMDRRDDPRVQRAVDHLVGLVDENGWRCVVAPELGKFRGPGRKADPCPIANLYALKALAQEPEMLDSPAARTSTEMLLWRWEHRAERKLYMFGIGHGLPEAQVPLRVVRRPARGGHPEPLPLPAGGLAIARDGGHDHRSSRRARALHRQLHVPGLERLVLRRQEEPVGLAHLSGAAHREADPAHQLAQPCDGVSVQAMYAVEAKQHLVLIGSPCSNQLPISTRRGRTADSGSCQRGGCSVPPHRRSRSLDQRPPLSSTLSDKKGVTKGDRSGSLQ